MIHSGMFLFLPRIVRLAATGPQQTHSIKALQEALRSGLWPMGPKL